MAGLLLAILGCSLALPDAGEGDSSGDRSVLGGTSTETVGPREDTAAPVASHAPDTADTGRYEYGVVTDVRITLPSEDFSTKVGEWFTVEFALVDDADEPADHWRTLVAVLLHCSGVEQPVGGLDDFVGNAAIMLGGALNPREVTVMVSTPCDGAVLEAFMVPYKDTLPIHAYSEPFVVL